MAAKAKSKRGQKQGKGAGRVAENQNSKWAPEKYKTEIMTTIERCLNSQIETELIRIKANEQNNKTRKVKQVFCV